MPPSAIRLRTRVCSSLRFLFSGAGAISGWILSEKIVNPTESCGSTPLKNTSSPSLARFKRPSVFIEPDVSSTSRMFAGLRSRRQAALIAASTRGSGSSSTRSGCLGSAPLATVIGATGGVSRSAGRKLDLAASCGVISSARYSWNAFAPSACSGDTHGALSVKNGESESNVPSSG